MALKIIQVADRPGWAIDKLAKPITEQFDNVDMSYDWIRESRWLATNYSPKTGNRQYCRETGNDYDVVHFHMMKTALMGIDRLKEGLKKVITAHTIHGKDFYDRFTDEQLSNFDLIICPIILLRDYFKGRGFNAVWLPTAIDMKEFNSGRFYGRNYAGYAGRAIAHKRFSIMRRACKNAGLRFYGTGYIEDSKEYTNDKNGITDQEFIWKDFTDQSNMPAWFNNLDIYISISEPFNETGPLPVLEAMASGVPLISTRTGWAEDNCEHEKNIYFVDEDTASDPNKLGSVLKRYCDNKELLKRIRINALELIKGFDIKDYNEKLMKLYEGL